jgi:hypothetical protein
LGWVVKNPLRVGLGWVDHICGLARILLNLNILRLIYPANEFIYLLKTVLAIPATSTTDERVFSAMGLLVDTKKATMNTSTISMSIFVRQNHKLFP